LSSIIFIYIFFLVQKQSNRVVLVILVAAGCGVATVFFLSFVLLLFYFLRSSIVLQWATATATAKTRSLRPDECNTGSTQSNRWNHTATNDFYLFILIFLYVRTIAYAQADSRLLITISFRSIVQNKSTWLNSVVFFFFCVTSVL
jgi:NADH:ubiquinone oxidoreductase subunit 3 (subunit A)